MPDRSRSPRGAAAPSVADLRAVLAEARRELAVDRERRAADQRWAAERRQEFVDFLKRTFRDCTELAVLARGAGVSSDLIEYWYRAPAPPEPEPEAEPEPQ